MFKRIILSPFTLIFSLVTKSRNYMYDKKILKSTKFTFPIVCIGNLSVGGTGKTPHTDYLITLLKEEYKVAVLSRGYNRKTNGYLNLTLDSTAENVGDEPLFYKWKHKEINVAVCEDRVFGVSQLANSYDSEMIYLLDDAFQHRSIKAGLNIVLTEFSNLYTRDYLMPVGKLREDKKGAKRADIIIVTKCPFPIESSKKEAILKELKPKSYQLVFFSYMKYNPIYPILVKENITNEDQTDVILVCGIANPKAINEELRTRFKNVYNRTYKDHYNYKIEDIESIIRTYKNLETQNKIILTTEKDATRLYAFKEMFLKEKINIFCLPIEVKFDTKEKNTFDTAIKHYLDITLPPKTIEEFNTFLL